jgi:chromosome segregation ATPase
MADEAEGNGSPTSKESMLGRVTSIVALVRDVGVILGIPAVLAVGLQLYDLHTKALEAQVKAAEAQVKIGESQVKALEAQNDLLKLTQYDRALSLLKSQRELFENERNSLEKQIADLRKAGGPSEAEIADFSRRLAATQDQIALVDAIRKECLAAGLDPATPNYPACVTKIYQSVNGFRLLKRSHPNE